MKLSDKYVGLNMPRPTKEVWKKEFIRVGNMEESRKETADFYFEETDTNYLVCDSSRQVIDQIKLTDSFFDFVPDTKVLKATVLVNKHEFYRFEVGQYLSARDIMVLHCYTEPAEKYPYMTMNPKNRFDAFRIDFQSKEVFYGNDKSYGPDRIKGVDLSEIPDYINWFIKAYIYIFCSNTEIEVIAPGQKNNKPKNKGKVVNDSGIPVIAVHSKWNVTTIRSEGFGVRGHFRFQRHGEGNKQVKVIWIEPFEKKGYTRTAPSENF